MVLRNYERAVPLRNLVREIAETVARQHSSSSSSIPHQETQEQRSSESFSENERHDPEPAAHRLVSSLTQFLGRFAVQLFRALIFLANHGRSHCDISFGNVMLEFLPLKDEEVESKISASPKEPEPAEMSEVDPRRTQKMARTVLALADPDCGEGIVDGTLRRPPPQWCRVEGDIPGRLRICSPASGELEDRLAQEHLLRRDFQSDSTEGEVNHPAELQPSSWSPPSGESSSAAEEDSPDGGDHDEEYLYRDLEQTSAPRLFLHLIDPDQMAACSFHNPNQGVRDLWRSAKMLFFLFHRLLAPVLQILLGTTGGQASSAKHFRVHEFFRVFVEKNLASFFADHRWGENSAERSFH